MKELWTANPFCLMNRPFAEMGYNSSGLNIAPSAFCWQLAGPSRTIRLLPAHHPSTLCAPPADAPQTICNTRHNIWRPPQAICRRSAQHLAVPCTASAISPQTIRHRTAQHPPTPARHPLTPCRHLPARTDALNGPQNKPSAQAGALNPRKNTFCVIVNCPLQIKPVFYFLFTSIASPAHRIRVKSSLLRLGRSCLALPFTHLGKDIT